jgi:hypothetical protein
LVGLVVLGIGLGNIDMGNAAQEHIAGIHSTFTLLSEA